MKKAVKKNRNRTRPDRTLQNPVLLPLPTPTPDDFAQHHDAHQAMGGRGITSWMGTTTSVEEERIRKTIALEGLSRVISEQCRQHGIGNVLTVLRAYAQGVNDESGSPYSSPYEAREAVVISLGRAIALAKPSL